MLPVTGPSRRYPRRYRAGCPAPECDRNWCRCRTNGGHMPGLRSASDPASRPWAAAGSRGPRVTVARAPGTFRAEAPLAGPPAPFTAAAGPTPPGAHRTRTGELLAGRTFTGQTPAGAGARAGRPSGTAAARTAGRDSSAKTTTPLMRPVRPTRWPKRPRGRTATCRTTISTTTCGTPKPAGRTARPKTTAAYRESMVASGTATVTTALTARRAPAGTLAPMRAVTPTATGNVATAIPAGTLVPTAAGGTAAATTAAARSGVPADPVALAARCPHREHRRRVPRCRP